MTQPPPGPADPDLKPIAVSSAAASFTVISRGQPKPDMFAAGRDVIVEGQLNSAGTIDARQVLTSCPSKYVPKQPK